MRPGRSSGRREVEDDRPTDGATEGVGGNGAALGKSQHVVDAIDVDAGHQRLDEAVERRVVDRVKSPVEGMHEVPLGPPAPDTSLMRSRIASIASMRPRGEPRLLQAPALRSHTAVS